MGSGIRGAGSGSSLSDRGIPDRGSERSGRSASPSQHPASDSTEPASRIPHPDSEAICVAIDILDEDHSLRLAMRRLARDPALRVSLGAAGQRHWINEHSMARMVEDYERILSRASALPVPGIPLPAHLVNDGDAVLKQTLRQLSVGPVWQ